MKIRFYFLTLFMGITFMVAGQDDDAAEATATGLYNEALTSMKAKDYEAAFSKFVAAIEKADPSADEKVVKLAKANGSSAAYGAGNTLLKAKKYDEAMTRFSKGLELNEKSYTCAYGKAKVLAAKKSPEALDAYFAAAELAKSADKADRAKSYVKSAGKIISKSYFAKDYDATISNGEKYLAVDESADVSYYVAKSLMKKGKGSDAVAHAMKAKELGGAEKEGKFIMAYAEALEASGDKTGAKKVFLEVPKGKYFESAQYKAKN